MPTHYTIAVHDHQLCVVYATTAYDEPTIYFNYWPTTLSPSMYQEIIGASTVNDRVMDPRSSGLFWARKEGGRWTEGCNVPLLNGGSTLPIHTYTKPYVSPKARGKETRYYEGEWCKLLKLGWVVITDPKQFIPEEVNK